MSSHFICIYFNIIGIYYILISKSVYAFYNFSLCNLIPIPIPNNSATGLVKRAFLAIQYLILSKLKLTSFSPLWFSIGSYVPSCSIGWALQSRRCYGKNIIIMLTKFSEFKIVILTSTTTMW